MSSSDYIYDIVEKLEEEKIEYVICIVRHGKKESKIDIHYDIKSDESLDMICNTFDKICSEEPDSEDNENDENE